MKFSWSPRRGDRNLRRHGITFDESIADIAKEYWFDYSKAKPNRFANRMKDGPLVAVIDPDAAKVFTTSEQVNKALRDSISAIPEK
jgi:uncharacterized DUF497 family protein